VTVFVVVTFNFILFRVLPGDPAVSGMRDPRLSADTIAALQQRFGLDKPTFVNLEGGNPFDTQYVAYLRQLLSGDLGMSYAYRNTAVTDLLVGALGNTVLLVLTAQIFAILVGTTLGMLAAWRRGTRLDVSTLTFALFMWSMPTFFMGIIFLYLGSTWFGLPTGGRMTIGAAYATFGEQFIDVARHLVLPVGAFGIILIGEYVLIMRSSVIEVFSEDYVLTAKAKGLSTGEIVRKHALRNAMLPIATLIALNLGFTVAGAIQIETVFSIPGVGMLTVEAVSRRDYPVLQGAFLLLAVSVVIANFVAEVIYGWLDPRVVDA
jgi:peptide/nickel transport system permease protein